MGLTLFNLILKVAPLNCFSLPTPTPPPGRGEKVDKEKDPFPNTLWNPHSLKANFRTMGFSSPQRALFLRFPSLQIRARGTQG